MFCISLLPLFVVSRTVCPWISVGFLDSGFLCFLLKTNLCKCISNVNVGSRWVPRVAIFKAVSDVKFSI